MEFAFCVACHEKKGLHQQLVSNASAKSPVLELAAEIACSHHERWDGSGYPRGLAGEEIPLVGQITTVADVVDALRSRRSYKEAMSWDQCLKILEEGRATHFDPRILDALLAAKNEVMEFDKTYADEHG